MKERMKNLMALEKAQTEAQASEAMAKVLVNNPALLELKKVCFLLSPPIYFISLSASFSVCRPGIAIVSVSFFRILRCWSFIPSIHPFSPFSHFPIACFSQVV